MFTTLKKEKRLCLYKMKTLNMMPEKVNRSTNIYYQALKDWYIRWLCIENMRGYINNKLHPFYKDGNTPTPDPEEYKLHETVVEHMINQLRKTKYENKSFKITYVTDILTRERY